MKISRIFLLASIGLFTLSAFAATTTPLPTPAPAAAQNTQSSTTSSATTQTIPLPGDASATQNAPTNAATTTLPAQQPQQNDPNQTILSPTPPAPVATAPALIPSPPSIHAKGYVLMDANSGYIIAQKNADVHMPPASLTKLMSLYIIASELKNGQIHLDDKVRISEKAWRVGGSKMFVKVGTDVPVKDLVQGIIVASGNDATVAMAEYIGGTEDAFVNLMNQMATTLGLANSHFKDCNGLPAPDHYSSPMDIAKIARAIILNFPEYYQWFDQKWITYNGIKQPNRNRLLWRDPTVDGLKTGHTNAAGFCLAASAVRDGMRLVSVVMNAPTDNARADDNEALLNYGFRFYKTHKLYAANTPIATPRVWFGAKNTTPFGLTSDLYVTIPTGQYKKIKANLILNDKLKAPIVKGQSYGSVQVTLDNKVIAEQPIVALENNPKGGIGARTMDHIAHFFHGWFGGNK